MAGNAAELRLQVTLDRQFFRGQLAALSQIAAGYNFPINVTFDRRSIQNELNALGANIRRRNYRLTVETNLSAEIAKAETLATKLAALAGKLKVGGGGFAQSQQGAAGLIEYMQTQGLSGRGGGFVGVGRSARVQAALEELTVKQLQGLARSEGIGGVSRLKKSALVDKLLNDLSQTAMENILGNAQMALRRPVRGVFPAGRTVQQGPLRQYGMGGPMSYEELRSSVLGESQRTAGAPSQTRGVFAGFTERMRGLRDIITGEDAATLARDQRRFAVRSGAMGSPFGQYGFPMAGMMGPSSPLGRITAQSSMFAGGPGGPGGGGGGRGLGGLAGGVPNLPGAGAIRSLGDEFANAAKQVLLFGTAYKALAFLTNFPAQVSESVAALQSFRNTLNAISPTAQEAAASNQTILDLVDKYNIPLESARSGFTKLYASMQPAGFSGEEIRNLFEGISKGAATFGMSADKVDRVNYAFAQMASKGQVMSEELKGQLGDVLPGAMAIFAKAAGFEGTDAITKFSKALEDGAYKGDAMKTLLTNVGIEMNKQFGPGAEGAAKSFQGLMNRMQNSLKQLYEAFEPVAVGFLNQVVVPMTNGIKTLTDGFNAFFTGAGAKTLGGAELKTQLEQLRPAFEGIRRNIEQVLPVFKVLGGIALELGKVFIQLAGNPITGFFLRTYAAILPVTVAIRALNLQAIIPMIASLIRAIPAFIAFNAAQLRGATVATAFRTAVAQTGQTATVAAGQIRLVSAAMATLGSAAIMAGIGVLIERIMTLKSAVDGVSMSTQAMMQSISSMANVGSVGVLKNVAADTQKQLAVFKELRKYVGTKPGERQKLTPGAAAKMEELGLGGILSGPNRLTGERIVTDPTLGQKIIDARIAGLTKIYSETQKKLPLAEKVAADLASQTKAPPAIVPITPAAGDESSRSKLKAYESDRTKELESQREQALNFLEQQRATLEISERQYALSKADTELKYERLLIEERNRIAVSQINKEKYSAADRLKALQDQEVARNTALDKAESDHVTKMTAANAAMLKPIDDAIDSEKLLMKEQQMRIENYREGTMDLLPLQQADLEYLKQAKDYSEKDLIFAQEKLLVLRDTIAARIQQAQLMQQEATLSGLRSQIGVTGQGLGAGFIGEAGSAYEKALLEPGATEEYATKVAKLTEQLSLVRMHADLAKQSVEGIGNAFATTLIDGTLAMAEGSKGMKETFADLLKSLAQILFSAAKQMISTYIAIGIARMFAGMGGSKGGTDLGGLSAYGGGGGGQPTLADFPLAGQRANGGPVRKGKFPYIVGERGPELFMPEGNGEIIPHEDIFRLGGAFGGGPMGPFFAAMVFSGMGYQVGVNPRMGNYGQILNRRANGGAVAAGSNYLVGERGPEMFVPSIGGASVSGPTNVVVNVDAKGTSAQGNDAQANGLGRVLAAAVQEELIRQKRPGGLLA